MPKTELRGYVPEFLRTLLKGSAAGVVEQASVVQEQVLTSDQQLLVEKLASLTESQLAVLQLIEKSGSGISKAEIVSELKITQAELGDCLVALGATGLAASSGWGERARCSLTVQGSDISSVIKNYSFNP